MGFALGFEQVQQACFAGELGGHVVKRNGGVVAVDTVCLVEDRRSGRLDAGWFSRQAAR